MLPNTAAAPSVELLIPGDRFIDAMRDIAAWLADADIVSPCATYRKDKAGDLNLRIVFPQASEAASFAALFGGRVAP